jgi:hypothetical protein
MSVQVRTFFPFQGQQRLGSYGFFQQTRSPHISQEYFSYVYEI